MPLCFNDDDTTLNTFYTQIWRVANTHIAVVNVEDMDLCWWLNFLHSGSVPAAQRE